MKRRREQLGWTHGALATRAKVSERILAAAEAGERKISLATLGRIATALDVPLAELVAPPNSYVAHVGVVVWRGREPHSQARMLLSQPASRDVELWEWSLDPKESYTAEADPPGRSAFIYVVSGELALDVSGRSVVIGPEGFYAHPCDQPYSYANHGTQTCRFVHVVIA